MSPPKNLPEAIDDATDLPAARRRAEAARKRLAADAELLGQAAAERILGRRAS